MVSICATARLHHCRQRPDAEHQLLVDHGSNELASQSVLAHRQSNEAARTRSIAAHRRDLQTRSESGCQLTRATNSRVAQQSRQPPMKNRPAVATFPSASNWPR
jgi:hypothetical protein